MYTSKLRAADKDVKMKAKEVSKLEKEALKLEKAFQKEQKQIDDMIKRGYRPEEVAAKLGLNKLEDATTSKAWPFYQAFLAKYKSAKELRKAATNTA
ncbi:hypothetical protein BBJ29_007336 [Phytophthora kernoviae]|uniref:Uncharacterized protein n=1 Tax=Phytophthora kernoviae TaxID=325452 RepID=A0A3R7GMA8_9STRA|nr:hypothetical protein BBJ29_007336 [Phytophthora kernoviae]